MLNITFEGLSVEGNPLNHKKEDDYIIDNNKNFFMVTDGITRPLYDKCNPQRTSFRDYQDDKHFSYDVAHLMCLKTKEYIYNYSLKEALIKANKDVNEYYNKHIYEYYEKDFSRGIYAEKTFEKPGCCGACGLIENDQLIYTNFGDCVIFLNRDYKSILLAPKQNEKAVKTYSLFKNRTEYVNYYVNKKVKNGYAIADGNENFSSLLEIKSLVLKENDIIMACSDGLYAYLRETPFIDSYQSLQDFITGERTLDSQKKLKYSDDMTIVRSVIR